MGVQHPLKLESATELPKSIAMYDDLWQRYLAIERAHHEALRTLSAEEGAVTCKADYSRCFKGVASHEETEFNKVAADIVSAIVAIAERTFCAPGATLSISDRDYKENLTERNEEGFWIVRADFRPSDIWRRLEAEYGGDRGRDLAYRQAADAIVQTFGLSPGTAVKPYRGGCELEARIWVQMDYRGKTLSYSCQERLSALSVALDGFLAWASTDSDSWPQRTVNSWARQFIHSHTGYKSRATVSGDGVEFVMFYEKMLLRLSSELSGKLNEFLSLYSSRFNATGDRRQTRMAGTTTCS